MQQYDQLAPFNEGRAAARRGEKWGYINTKGEEVIECQFDRAEEFHEGISNVISEDKPYYINRKGDKLFYGEGGRFSQGLALLDDGRVVNPKGEEVFKINLNNMAYTMSRVPNQSSYTLYPYFIDGVLRVWTDNEEMCYDLNGNTIPLKDHTEPKGAYQTYTEDVDNNDFDSGNHTGLKDNNGNIVIAPRYAEVSNISNGVALVAFRENDAYYFGLDEQGTELRATDGFLEDYTPRFYAYADLNGNTTFPQSTLDHIVEANRIGEERWKSMLNNREIENQREEESKVCPEWIEGTWKWSGYVNGYNIECAICFDIVTSKYALVTKDIDVQVGTFTYDGEERVIRCRPKNSNCYTTSYEVDIYGKRISLGNGRYFERVGNKSTSGSNSQSNSVHFYTDADVIAWLSDKYFYCEGTKLHIANEGIRVDGQYVTGAPRVTQFSNCQAIIEASPVVGKAFIFRLNALNGTLTEQNGEVWILRR